MVFTVMEIKTVLWCMQEDLASFRRWEMGEIMVPYLVFLFMILLTGFLNFFAGLISYQVCCDGCNVWVHAECAKISSKLFKVCLVFMIQNLQPKGPFD